MDKAANHFLNCAQCDFYEVYILETAPEAISRICSKREILEMTSHRHFEPPPDFGCKLAIPKDVDEPTDSQKREPANLEFFTCENCKHFGEKEWGDSATGAGFIEFVCLNSLVVSWGVEDYFRSTSNFGCKLFEAKHPPAAPVKMEFD